MLSNRIARSSLLVVSLILGTSLAAPVGSAHAEVYVSDSMSMSPDVVHVIPGRFYEPKLVGGVGIYDSAPCNGECVIKWRIYAPGSATAWAGYISSGLPGDYWDSLRLKFPLTSEESLTDGVHDVRVLLYDSTGTLISDVSVASIGIYSELTPAADIRGKNHEVLEDRRHSLSISISEEWSDGYARSYRGEDLRAILQSSRDGISWNQRARGAVSSSTNSTSFWIWGERTLYWRAKLIGRTTGSVVAVTPVEFVTVWLETNTFDIRRAKFSPGDIYRGEAVAVDGIAWAKYTDGLWHEPISRFDVQYRKQGSDRWVTLAREEFRAERMRAKVRPQANGRLRVKVGDKASSSEAVRVREPFLRRIDVVDRSRGCVTGKRVCVWKVRAISNLDRGMAGVRLQFQHVDCGEGRTLECAPQSRWRRPKILDRTVSGSTGYAVVRVAPPTLGCLRVWSPGYGKGTDRNYCGSGWA